MILRNPVPVLALMLAGLLVPQSTSAQTRHRLTHGNMAPGLSAQHALMANPQNLGFEQPVRIVAPSSAQLSYWSEANYVPASVGQAVFGLLPGYAYRFQLSGLGRNGDQSIFPSVELLSRLHPPQGHEHDFSIPVTLTEDDIHQALQGKLVSKVIYLEAPETALPFQQRGDALQTTDIGGREDVLHTAESLGRPMAIVRVGSRQPLQTDIPGEFEFHGPTPTFISAGEVDEIEGTIEHAHNPYMPAPSIEQMSLQRDPVAKGKSILVPSTVPVATGSAARHSQSQTVPPIVDGSRKPSFNLGDQ